jgi:hypothetical protein
MLKFEIRNELPYDHYHDGPWNIIKLLGGSL